MFDMDEKRCAIRPARMTDLGTLMDLLQQLYDEIEHDVPSHLALSVAAALIADDEGFVALLAIDGSEVVGALTAIESVAIYAGGRIGVIEEFFVKAPWRSRGVGRALIGEISRRGVERNWRRVEVTAPPLEPQNERAVAFYRSNGFETSGPHLKLNLGPE
jgi:GNAT superfamily N-acetyltransferase